MKSLSAKGPAQLLVNEASGGLQGLRSGWKRYTWLGKSRVKEGGKGSVRLRPASKSELVHNKEAGKLLEGKLKKRRTRRKGAPVCSAFHGTDGAVQVPALRAALPTRALVSRIGSASEDR